MTNTKTAVLVVGASGQMGTKIVDELLASGRATVRATARLGSNPEAVKALRDKGVEVVTADLGDDAALARACAGITVVVSAVQGLRDVIVDGQTRLLRAAEGAGVTRFLPSDYSIDLFLLKPGENRNLDLRREFDAILDASPVRGTSLLCGAFTEMVLRGFGAPDETSGTMKIWGEGRQPLDFTTTSDAAKYIAAAALDEEAPRIVRVAGDTVTERDLQKIFAELRGEPVGLQMMGSIDDLRRSIEDVKRQDAGGNDAFPRWQQLQYLHNMVSGRAKLNPLDNARYPEVTPQSVREFLRASRS